MEEKEVIAEVQQLIDERRAAGDQPMPRWIVHELLQRHSDVRGADADWHLVTSRRGLQQIVRGRMHDLPDVEAGKQEEMFPGWTGVKAAYSAVRDGERRIIETQDLTVTEIGAIIDEFRRQREGLGDHIAALEKYRDFRIEQEAASAAAAR